MLSTNDLQQLSQLLDKKLDAKFDERLTPIEKDIKGMKDDLAGVKDDLTGVKNDLAGVKKDLANVKRKVNKIDKTQNVMLEVLDREQVDQKKRIIRIEQHLGLTT